MNRESTGVVNLTRRCCCRFLHSGTYYGGVAPVKSTNSRQLLKVTMVRGRSTAPTRVNFVYPWEAPFIKTDMDILGRNYSLVSGLMTLDKRHPSTAVAELSLLAAHTAVSDVSFAWFGGTHSQIAVRMARLLRKKSLVVFGGYEVASVPDLGYGALLHKKSESSIRYILTNADEVLTVDEGLKTEARERFGALARRITTVPTGYDCRRFRPDGKKERLVMTVCSCRSLNRAKLKGIDTFVTAARSIPSVKFLIVGLDEPLQSQVKASTSSNIELVGPLGQDDLIKLYQRASVYCQLSLREGLPNALCEAMLCECVPVGTDIAGNRTAIGNTGYLVRWADSLGTSEAILEALESSNGPRARKRISENMSIERREKTLLELINHLVR